MYSILPETENRTLEEIELHFSDNSKKLTDRKIVKLAAEEHAKDEEAAIPPKPISIISDFIEMKNGISSVHGHSEHNSIDAAANGTSKPINNNGCDNYAFTMDR